MRGSLLYIMFELDRPRVRDIMGTERQTYFHINGYSLKDIQRKEENRYSNTINCQSQRIENQGIRKIKKIQTVEIPRYLRKKHRKIVSTANADHIGKKNKTWII